MKPTAILRRWRGPPLMLQILALLLGGLVVAQFVTLLLTLLLPPKPSPQHSLAAIAAALGGGETEQRPDRLERVVQAGPPDLRGPGWLVSERSRQELAGLLGAAAGDVRLAFYTPLPFAGTAPSPQLALMANDGPMPPLRADRMWQPASLLVLAQFPGGSRVPAGALPPRRDTLPPGMLPGNPPSGARGTRPDLPAGVPIGNPRDETLFHVEPADGRHGSWIPGDGGVAVPPLLQGSAPATTAAGAVTAPAGLAQSLPPAGEGALPRFGTGLPRFAGPARADRLLPPAPMPAPALATAPLLGRAPASAVTPPDRDTAGPAPLAAARMPAPALALEPSPAAPGAPPPLAATATDIVDSAAGEHAIPLAPQPRGLFGLAPVPFVEGNFVAALRLADGRWSVVRPAPEPFPNAWQRRVLLWFAIAFAIVAPVGWLFARRIVKPLSGFAEAAERLGRDPAAQLLDLDGPAEIGRAARAFNLMQDRLKSFVGDRTAMVGAISHDLRTPLTRLRFRIEEVEDDRIRDGMIEEVAEMEAMITSVLNFIRDASTPGRRERLDLATIVEDVVEDAALVGGDVGVEIGVAAPVEVDVLGMRRLLANLVENAVKYGGSARIRLTRGADEVIADILDRGPGLPEHDLERAFEPFYRTADAHASDKRGSGLGLAVCRSIARAHGGDVRLLWSPDGFMARLRLPLAFDAVAA